MLQEWGSFWVVRFLHTEPLTTHSATCPFLHHSQCNLPSEFRLSCPVPHWRALNGFPPAATLSIGTKRPCCVFTTLFCPSPMSPLCLASADLVICVRHEVICNCRSGMSSPSTMSRTVDVFFLVPAKAQRVFLISWSAEYSPSPSHCHTN